LANRLGIDKVFLNDEELTNYLKNIELKPQA